jgi:ferrochelatase
VAGVLQGTSPVGVVLLNLGGPRSEAQIPDFLRRMLSDPDVMDLPWPFRPCLARWIARRRSPHVAAHYRAIGGRSPIDEQTRAQVEALRAKLSPACVVRHVFRHSSPFADRVLAGLAEKGVTRVIALPAYPHWSRSTIGSAMLDLRRAAQPLGLELHEVGSYPDAPGYIEALASRTIELLEDGTHVIASAHGLPQRMIDRGDPYVDEVNKTVAALGEGLPPGTPLQLAFQSRLGRVEWTRPYLVDEIERLSKAGVRSVLVVPISFVAENFETLYELDRELAQWAASCGIESYKRVPVPGTHPAFVRELASMVTQAIEDAGWAEPQREVADVG